MKKILRKFWLLIFAIAANTLLLLVSPDLGTKSLVFTSKNFINFLVMLTPIFICIGLLDVWVEKETMIKIMGEQSGLQGIIIAFLLGVVTAVPLYALLPVAAMMLKKGSTIVNVLIFVCSCASIRIPLLLFEVSTMGWKFTMTRFLANIFVVLVIAFLIERLLTEKDVETIYYNANRL